MTYSQRQTTQREIGNSNNNKETNERKYHNNPKVNSSSKYQTIIYASQYRDSRYIEVGRGIGNTAIRGKKGRYNHLGEATGPISNWPYAEYKLQGCSQGGEYLVTVKYKLDKKLTPKKPHLIIGMDNLNTKNLNLKSKSGSVKATFRANNLNRDIHSVKLWLPSDGVIIEKIEVKRTGSSNRR